MAHYDVAYLTSTLYIIAGMAFAAVAMVSGVSEVYIFTGGCFIITALITLGSYTDR